MPGQVQEKPPATGASAAAIEDDDEPDEWDKRIFSTGCAEPAAPPAKSTSPPVANTPRYAKPVPKATKPAVAASTPSPAASYSDVVYQAKSIAYEDASEDGEVTDPVAVDWTRSFYGISAQPVTEKQFKSLMQPVDEKDIEVKPDGVIYLPEIKYRRRLNEAFGPMGWGLIPKGEAVVGDSIVTREYALIVDGRPGRKLILLPEQLPSAVEGCKSNALMRCCKDLGIASELWDPHFVRWFKKNHMEEVWVEHVTTKKKRLQWYRKGDVDVSYPYKVSVQIHA
ncbi:hypothetical protein TrVFT333_004085 [Trichoderma virens FT-333]|nr:hypothetical protein TrVFT333_004085 [Trichoderma virens FT-333]